MARFLLISALLASGCYAPKVGDCAYTCNANVDCPNSQACDLAQHACRAPGVTGLCGESTDGGGPAFAPSNYTLADLDGLPAQPIDITEITLLDTQQPTPSSKILTPPGAEPVRLYHVTSLHIEESGVLDLSGIPAIFAVDGEVVIDGILHAGGDRDCKIPAGASGGPCSDGGPGGPSGFDGGPAGGCGGPSPGPVVHVPSTLLVPLVGGCVGGSAGLASEIPMSQPGLGGQGGGGVELSSQLSIVVHGRIAAGGQGGTGGSPDMIGSPNGLPGGGGGGGGGGILIEAPTVLLTVAASVCAVGGGGGAGAYLAGPAPPMKPTAGPQGQNACMGPIGDAPGGLTGDPTAGDGGPGSSTGIGLPGLSSVAGWGGGGGGGAAGVIVFRAHVLGVETPAVGPQPNIKQL